MGNTDRSDVASRSVPLVNRVRIDSISDQFGFHFQTQQLCRWHALREVGPDKVSCEGPSDMNGVAKNENRPEKSIPMFEHERFRHVSSLQILIHEDRIWRQLWVQHWKKTSWLRANTGEDTVHVPKSVSRIFYHCSWNAPSYTSKGGQAKSSSRSWWWEGRRKLEIARNPR